MSTTSPSSEPQSDTAKTEAEVPKSTKQRHRPKKRSHSASKTLARLTTRRGWRELRQQTPSWLTSLLLHVAVLFVLAYVTLPLSSPPELSLKAAQINEENFELEEVDARRGLGSRSRHA